MSSEHPPQEATIDHRHVDWRRVRRATYHLRQQFSYEYPGPIADLRQRLIVVPNDAHGGQRLLGFNIASEPVNAESLEERDAFGNRVVRLQVERVEQAIAFAVAIDVERRTDDHPLVREHEAGVFLRETNLTEADGALRQAARGLASRLRGSVEERATAINHWVHEHLRYERDLTGVRTTAAEAFALGGGVCQDFAHVMLGCLRSLGLPARYVSGYLLTEPPPGQSRLVGSDASHAWVSVYLPSESGRGRWADLDPTNARAPGEDYVTLAIGRDYSDVSPVRGLIHGGAHHTLRVAVTVTPLDADAAAAFPTIADPISKDSR